MIFVKPGNYTSDSNSYDNWEEKAKSMQSDIAMVQVRSGVEDSSFQILGEEVCNFQRLNQCFVDRTIRIGLPHIKLPHEGENSPLLGSRVTPPWEFPK